jgi:hypothetical protein|tara:strand:- start:137 stop:592 length:456 start_codon:yes stop_codon:yes gene_type:complete
MMTKDEMMNELGLAGEKIIINMLSESGHKVKTSINKYDSEKDLLVEDKKVEVKTQVPFVMQDAFTFKPNQLKKCRSVDILYFVCVPPPRHKDKWAGWVFEADPKAFTTRNYTTKDGRVMILIDRSQPALKPVKKISDEEVKELQKYSVSGY